MDRLALFDESHGGGGGADEWQKTDSRRRLLRTSGEAKNGQAWRGGREGCLDVPIAWRAMDRWWRSSGCAARDKATCVRPEVLAFRHHGDDGCDIGLVFKSTVRLD